MFRSAWGKILGAFFGFSIAGPIGALFGVLVGTLFDKGLTYSREMHPHAVRGQTRKTFNHITFAVMGYVAKSDGRVSEEEIESARRMMDRMVLSESEKYEAMEAFAQGKAASFHVGVALTELKYACRQHPALLKMFADIQYQVVVGHARGVDLKKQQTLNIIFEQLGFVPVFRTYQQSSQRQQYQNYYQQYQQSSYSPPPFVDEKSQAFKILGVSEQASEAEIKKAYRKLMSKHHPDKLIAKGLSEKQIKEGTAQAQKIQAAYEKIRQYRGYT